VNQIKSNKELEPTALYRCEKCGEVGEYFIAGETIQKRCTKKVDCNVICGGKLVKVAAIPDIAINERISIETTFKVFKVEAMGMRMLLNLLSNQGPLECEVKRPPEGEVMRDQTMAVFLNSEGETVIKVVRDEE